MMGICVADISAGSVKGASGLLVFTEQEDRDIADPVCIRCGNCIAHCPMKLEPIYMYMYVKKGDYKKMEEYHVMDCFECGSCSWGCPGRLPLTHTFKVARRCSTPSAPRRRRALKRPRVNAAAAAGKEARA